ncbi:MAG: hypothetical protein ACYC5O_07845 [Anaerolineae bacterium]
MRVLVLPQRSILRLLLVPAIAIVSACGAVATGTQPPQPAMTPATAAVVVTAAGPASPTATDVVRTPTAAATATPVPPTMAATTATPESAAAAAAAATSAPVAAASTPAAGAYVLLAWNDLGMHCYNGDFSSIALLPPFNNLWAQVVQLGDPPHIVTSGITLEYSFPADPAHGYGGNTRSDNKTNFWQFVQPLFGVDLQPNVGLTGKGLSGTMDLDGDHFVAAGIPLTEYSDDNLTTRYPYQLALIVVRDAAGTELTRATVVAPVSTEMGCANCHSDGGVGAEDVATGNVATNILALHDEESRENYPAGQGALIDSQPVLCASCHGSNALGIDGIGGEVPVFSNAIHRQHAGEVSDDVDGCYNCHPGPETQCLRDVMSQKAGMTCIDCHGGMVQVSQNPNPWLQEPRCDAPDCHGSRVQMDQALYRLSTSHGGLYCEGCHDSTHAIAPSREANDAIKFVALQGEAGTLRRCTVCHATEPAGPFQHSATGE